MIYGGYNRGYKAGGFNNYTASPFDEEINKFKKRLEEVGWSKNLIDEMFLIASQRTKFESLIPKKELHKMVFEKNTTT